jgi:hypothetical protein
MKHAKHQFLESQELEVQENSLVDELVRFLVDFPEKTIGLISVDPSNENRRSASRR